MIYTYIIAMCLTTYLIRMLPLVIFQKKIENRFINSFLFYVPYACLSAMTLPSILTSTASVISAVAALLVAIVLSWRGKSLFTVAVVACLVVFVIERLPLPM